MTSEVLTMTARLGFEIGALLCAKAVLLIALYFAFFDSSHQMRADSPSMTTHILGAR
jgi:hypothetical protein